MDRRIYIGIAALLIAAAGACVLAERPSVWGILGLLAYWTVIVLALIAVIERDKQDNS
jgi:urea transporter